MEPDDYQLARIGLLAPFGARAVELGREIYDEACEQIDDLRTERDTLRATVAGLREAHERLERWVEEEAKTFHGGPIQMGRDDYQNAMVRVLEKMDALAATPAPYPHVPAPDTRTLPAPDGRRDTEKET